jgi:hypothetical protein
MHAYIAFLVVYITQVLTFVPLARATLAYCCLQATNTSVCNPSSLSYDCSLDLGGGLSVHWTLNNGAEPTNACTASSSNALNSPAGFDASNASSASSHTDNSSLHAISYSPSVDGGKPASSASGGSTPVDEALAGTVLHMAFQAPTSGADGFAALSCVCLLSGSTSSADGLRHCHVFACYLS